MYGILRANTICGSYVRMYITNKFKAKAIAFLGKEEKAFDVVDRLIVIRVQISKWLKMGGKIIHAFVDKERRYLGSLALPEIPGLKCEVFIYEKWRPT